MVTGLCEHRLHILLLADGLGLDGPAFGGDADHVLRQLSDALGLAAAAQADDVADVLLGNGLPLAGEGQQRLHCLGSHHHLLRLPGDPQLPVTVHHRHMEFRLQKPDIFIKRAEQIDGLFHSLDAYTLFHTGQAPLSLCSLRFRQRHGLADLLQTLRLQHHRQPVPLPHSGEAGVGDGAALRQPGRQQGQ